MPTDKPRAGRRRLRYLLTWGESMGVVGFWFIFFALAAAATGHLGYMWVSWPLTALGSLLVMGVRRG